MPYSNHFVLFFLLLISTTSFSQTQLSLAPEVAFPNKQVYHLETSAGNGVGASARLEWGRKQVKTMITAGYVSFAEHSYSYSVVSYSSKFKVVPMQLGLKYYWIKKHPKNSPFLSFEGGLMKTSTKRKYDTDLPDETYKFTDLSAAPGIGYQFDGLEAGFRLQYNLSDAGFTPYYYNIRVGYNMLALGKKGKD